MNKYRIINVEVRKEVTWNVRVRVPEDSDPQLVEEAVITMIDCDGIDPDCDDGGAVSYEPADWDSSVDYVWNGEDLIEAGEE